MQQGTTSGGDPTGNLDRARESKCGTRAAKAWGSPRANSPSTPYCVPFPLGPNQRGKPDGLGGLHENETKIIGKLKPKTPFSRPKVFYFRGKLPSHRSRTSGEAPAWERRNRGRNRMSLAVFRTNPRREPLKHITRNALSQSCASWKLWQTGRKRATLLPHHASRTQGHHQGQRRKRPT
jgi:hypothetical protein